MSVMYLIVPIALIVVFAAVVAYLWAARHGQFDDLTTPAIRVLHDDPAITGRSGDAPGPEPGPDPSAARAGAGDRPPGDPVHPAGGAGPPA